MNSSQQENNNLAGSTSFSLASKVKDYFQLIMRKNECVIEHNRNIKENMFKENDLKNVWIYIEDDKSIRQQFTKHFDKNYIKLYMNQNLIMDV